MNERLRTIYDEVAKCNRCGFCQAVCPIFEVTKDERSVARGHNVHVRKLIEGDLELDRELRDPLFECLLCRSCVANCFPAVRTDRSVVLGRAEYLKRVGQPKIMTFLFHTLLPDQRRMARYVRLAAMGKNSRVTRLVRALGLLKWFGRDLDKVEGIVAELPTRFFRDRLAELTLVPENPRMKVGYFVGCGFNFMLPQISEATVEVLMRQGAAIAVAENGCCGLPAYSYGDLEAARAMARKNIEILECMDVDLVMTECASCAARLKEYPELFADDPAMTARAERLAKRVKGFSELMQDRPLPAALGPREAGKVTYHDPCHMSRYQGIAREPRNLLGRIPGVSYVELPEADLCCGAAGSYNVLHYEQSMQVLDRKMENLRKTGADVITTECPACCIQLSYGVRRAGLSARVMHISELVRECCYGSGGK